MQIYKIYSLQKKLFNKTLTQCIFYFFIRLYKIKYYTFVGSYKTISKSYISYIKQIKGTLSDTPYSEYKTNYECKNIICSNNRIRTCVPTLHEQRPRPLDDTANTINPAGIYSSSQCLQPKKLFFKFSILHALRFIDHVKTWGKNWIRTNTSKL